MGLFRKKKEIVYDEAPSSARFVMQVEDALYISGRGTVVLGEIVKGTVNVGDIVTVSPDYSSSVDGIEANRTTIGSAGVGERVGLLLADIPRGYVEKGAVVYQ